MSKNTHIRSGNNADHKFAVVSSMHPWQTSVIAKIKAMPQPFVIEATLGLGK